MVGQLASAATTHMYYEQGFPRRYSLYNSICCCSEARSSEQRGISCTAGATTLPINQLCQTSLRSVAPAGLAFWQCPLCVILQANGSLLLATTAAEIQQLEARAVMLQQQGIPGVLLLSPRELKMHEPALKLPTGSMGLLVSSDAQINGKRTAFAMLDDCKRLAESGDGPHPRLQVSLGEGVVTLEPHGSQPGVTVVTDRRSIRAHQGVVVAAGVWSGQLLADCTSQTGWQRLLQPRRGHLLEMQPPAGMPRLNSGMMELSYTQHYSAAAEQQHAASTGPSPASSKSIGNANMTAVDITFTATTSASGSLLIGSSREFGGWDSTPSESIVSAIMARAATFLPDLSTITADELMHSTRVGLRPYALGGLPAVGPVPGLSGVVVAAGHEGSGLCLGPGTAELVLHHLLGLQLQQELEGIDAKDLTAAALELLPERRLGACTTA
eukprot:GHUV01026806.1.p1 GENE.GHUV01026806.1~~GHUV01026806.1.p1  ORF type:complete len:441 (+),score=126.12 GHUV01026806.1:624-1946(+)